MKEQSLPREPLWQNEYPNYHALVYQQKAVLLSQVFRENVNLGKSVVRLLKEQEATGIKVRTTTGKRDVLVSLTPIKKPPHPKGLP